MHDETNKLSERAKKDFRKNNIFRRTVLYFCLYLASYPQMNLQLSILSMFFSCALRMI